MIPGCTTAPLIYLATLAGAGASEVLDGAVSRDMIHACERESICGQ